MSGSAAMGSEWRRFMRKHWRAGALFVIGVALAFAWAVYVFLWFVSNAQSSSLVPSTLGLWTIGNLVTFIVYAILWEILLVGIPVAIGGVLGWQLWWKKLPEAEKMDYHMGGRKRATGGGGGGLFLFILFCVKVYIDGKWNVPIANFTLDYVVGSFLIILVLGVIIVGIPATIGLTWWIRRETKTP
jgi:hypothetical protein